MIRLSSPSIESNEIEAIVKVLQSGMLVQGKNVEQFENDLEAYINVPHAIALTSGTAALHLALSALDVKEGDAVFVPAFTFPATVNVVEIQKARPVLIDVEPNSYNIDPLLLEEKLRSWKGPEKPHSIIVVHEFGNPCKMDKIVEIARKYNLYVIEDAACALGTFYNNQHVGTFGDIGCFSWHPRKAITTGEGGACVTSSQFLSSQLNLLRNHGISRDNEGNIDFILPGYNYRLTDFQAALGIGQLKKFNKGLEVRKKIADLYLSEFSKIPSIHLPAKVDGHSWQTFMITLPETVNREKLREQFLQNGIETNLGAQAIHMLSYYRKKYAYHENDYPISAILYKHGLALPLHAQLSTEDALKVIDTAKKLLS